MNPSQRETLFYIPGCSAVRMTEDDEPSVQLLLEECSDFNLLVTGLPVARTDAKELFTDLPPGKDMVDKTIIGFYKGQNLVGIMDNIRGYPEPGTWFIGLMLLVPDERGKGMGRNLISGYEQWAGLQGAQAIRLGVVAENCDGYRFWERSGYQMVEKRPARRFGNKEQEIFLFRKELLFT